MDYSSFLITISPADEDLDAVFGEHRSDMRFIWAHFSTKLTKMVHRQLGAIVKVVGAIEGFDDGANRLHAHFVVEYNNIKRRMDNIRRQVGDSFMMKKINQISINIKRIKREEMTESSYDQNLIWSCAYAIKGVDTDKWNDDAMTLKWMTNENPQAIPKNEDGYKNVGASTYLYYHNSDPREDAILFLQEVIDEKNNHKEKQSNLKYVGLGKVKFFTEMMSIYDRRIGDNIEYKMWDALEEMYKQGYYLKDLQPKFILQNFRFMKGEDDKLHGFRLGQFDD